MPPLADVVPIMRLSTFYMYIIFYMLYTPPSLSLVHCVRVSHSLLVMKVTFPKISSGMFHRCQTEGGPRNTSDLLTFQGNVMFFCFISGSVLRLRLPLYIPKAFPLIAKGVLSLKRASGKKKLFLSYVSRTCLFSRGHKLIFSVFSSAD